MSAAPPAIDEALGRLFSPSSSVAGNNGSRSTTTSAGGMTFVEWILSRMSISLGKAAGKT